MGICAMQRRVVIGKYNSVLFVKRGISNHRVQSDLTIGDILYVIAGVSGVLLYGYIILMFISTYLNVILSSTSNNIGTKFHYFGNITYLYPLYINPLSLKIINLQFLSLFLLLLKLLLIESNIHTLISCSFFVANKQPYVLLYNTI